MIDICRPRNASPAKSSMFWLPLAATGLHAPFMFGVPSGLRAGMNVAATAFAHGKNRREICGRPAIGAARNRAAPPAPPSCPATGADTRNHASAVAMVDATDTRNAWITMVAPPQADLKVRLYVWPHDPRPVSTTCAGRPE